MIFEEIDENEEFLEELINEVALEIPLIEEIKNVEDE